MTGRPPRRRRLDALKAQLGNIECIDEGIDHANWIALVNPVIEAFRQQRRLRSIRPCNEALHQFPRRIIRRIGSAHVFTQAGSNAGVGLARSARLFCHLKLPKLLRYLSIPSHTHPESDSGLRTAQSIEYGLSA